MVDVRSQWASLTALDGIWPDGLAVTDETRVDADAALAGRLPFRGNGREWIEVGRRDIDWSGGHRQDQEWRAQLNRFFQLRALAAAFNESGDRRYVEAARDYLLDWLAAHPVGAAGDWRPADYDALLNLALRLGNSRFFGWLDALGVFLGGRESAAVFDDATVDRIIQSARAQLNYMAHHLTPIGNHRMAEADTLVTAACRLSFLDEADTWRDIGRAVLEEALHRQVLPDGVHVERVPDYHNWMTRIFYRHWQLARARPDATVDVPTDTVRRMLDYAIASTRPNGASSGLHDDAGPNGAGKYGALIDERRAFLREIGVHEADDTPPIDQVFPSAGQAILRDRWRETADYVTFDATPWYGTHLHLSRNAVQLDHAGQPLLVDPGKLSYEVTNPWMPYGKGTRAHNTVNINGWNQSPTDPRPIKHHHADGFDLVASEYEGGYWPVDYRWRFDEPMEGGIWARHHRTMLWVHERCLIIADAVQRAGPRQTETPSMVHTTELNWQLMPGSVEFEQGESRAVARCPDANLLMMFVDQPAQARAEVYEGQTEPPRGWVGGSAGMVAAPQVSMSAPMPGHFAEYITVLVPFTGRDAPRVEATLARPEPHLTVQLDLQWGDGRHDQTRWACRLISPLAYADGAAVLAHDVYDASGALTQQFRCE